ncbi:MAG: transcriptional repressor [Clostridia bacterium]|nr:transcriptional repressor [Clostridia bacterium]MBR5278841.1 transcriptional repressor [Clostridia bacterium]
MIKERNTKQKTVILSAVRSAKIHPTAEQVHAMVLADMPNISLGTVYRNLNHMAELGQIRRISVTNSPDRFDGDLSPHHHICCSECGEFNDRFDLPYDKSLDTLAEKKTGYKITRHETVFYGLCKNCKKSIKN